MITIDANLLIYSYNTSTAEHPAARKWLEHALSAPDPVRLSWSTVHSFLRIVTHPRIFPRPFSMRDARGFIEEWFLQPSVAILEPGERYWSIFRDLLTESQVRGNLVMDAHLAALAIEHGAELCTTDKDFARFDKLRVRNPLIVESR